MKKDGSVCRSVCFNVFELAQAYFFSPAGCGFASSPGRVMAARNAIIWGSIGFTPRNRLSATIAPG
jgi:hypothetical protein